MERPCPICNKPVGASAEEAPFRPFCSKRCKLVDLGSWLTGGYRISRPLAEEDLDEGVPEGARPMAGDDEGDEAEAPVSGRAARGEGHERKRPAN